MIQATRTRNDESRVISLSAKKGGTSTVPELPEVETVVRDLRGPLVGRRLTTLAVSRKALRRRWQPRWKKVLLGRRVMAVERRGKWIILDLEGPILLVHLGMTGQFTFVAAAETRQDHTHLVFGLDDGDHELRFRDIRRFGSATLFPDRQRVEEFFLAGGLGPEPFLLESGYWRKCLARTVRNLKAILLDQRIVAGVGNIYADEALFEARLSPRLIGKDISTRQAERLRSAIVTVLERAIAKRGSSIRDYVGGSGLMGEYQNEFRVYGRVGEPCPRCRTAIERTRLAGRSSHYCPNCQKWA
jgi:formamidopyrimidine-DNA glycosylase